MAAHVTYEFGGFRFEPLNLRLIHGDQVVPLTAKAADTLRLLVEQPDVVVTKDELMEALWPGVFVHENNLNQQISSLRRALSQNGDPSFIETVPRRGYRFAGPVRVMNGTNGSAHVVAPALVDLPPSIGTGEVASPAASTQSARRLGPARWGAVTLAVVAVAASALVGWEWRERARIARTSQAAVARGEDLLRKGDGRGAAIEFQEAIRLDATNARAYSSLAMALQRVSSHVALPRPGRTPSLEAAERAVALDPACGDCQGALGLFLFYHDWQWTPAETHLREAMRLAPEEEAILPSYAFLLAVTGRTAGAIEQIDLALRKRPFQVSWHVMRASFLYLDRQYAKAVAAADQALAIDERERGAWEWRSKALFQLGRGGEAVHALGREAFAANASDLDRAVREGGADAGLRMLLDITGDPRARVEQSWRRGPWRALLHDTDGALEEIETAYRMHYLSVVYFGVDPVYDGLRAHPRYQKVIADMGLRGVLPERAGAVESR